MGIQRSETWMHSYFKLSLKLNILITERASLALNGNYFICISRMILIMILST